MIRVLIPENKTRENKSDVRGLWLNDKGKLFYDYLKESRFNLSLVFGDKDKIYSLLKKIKTKYNQECIFFYDTDRQIAGIFYNQNKIEWLSHSIIKKHRLISKDLLRHYLKLYNGLTIRQNKKGYKIEIYFK